MSNKLIEKLRENKVAGNIQISENKYNIVTVYGSLLTEDPAKTESLIEEYMLENYPGKMQVFNVKYNDLLVIEDNTIEGDVIQSSDDIEIDEVQVLYAGMMDTASIAENDRFKWRNENNLLKSNNSVRVMNFISPLVLNQNLDIIDGNMRLELAIMNEIGEVPVVVIKTTPTQENLLRLTLNRSNEFQRWNYPDVDQFVDETPQAQPILEPLGFFGSKVLPTSYFSNSVVEYAINPFNTQQEVYQQEEGLAKWAEIRRKQMAEQSAAKRRTRHRKQPPLASLLDMVPSEEDFLPQYDLESEKARLKDKWRTKAGEITDHLDEIKLKEIEEKGGVFQVTKRKMGQVIEDRKNEFIKSIKETDKLTDLQKDEVIENVDDYAGMTIEEIAGRFEE